MREDEVVRTLVELETSGPVVFDLGSITLGPVLSTLAIVLVVATLVVGAKVGPEGSIP